MAQNPPYNGSLDRMYEPSHEERAPEKALYLWTLLAFVQMEDLAELFTAVSAFRCMCSFFNKCKGKFKITLLVQELLKKKTVFSMVILLWDGDRQLDRMMNEKNRTTFYKILNSDSKVTTAIWQAQLRLLQNAKPVAEKLHRQNDFLACFKIYPGVTIF